MNYEPQPYCANCYNFYNKDNRIPLIIPSCGHTFCSFCIQSFLSRVSPYQPFTCPEDKNVVPLTSNDISQFPKNFTLLRAVEQRETISPLKLQSDEMKGSTIIHKVESDDLYERNLTLDQEFTTKSPIDRASSNTVVRDFTSKFPTDRPSNMQFAAVDTTVSRYGTSFLPTESTLCKEHGKRLEFICLNHQCKICANCALVGTHKNHDIKSEDEVQREIKEKANQLNRVIQDLERTQTIMPADQFKSLYSMKLKEKEKELQDKVHRKVEEYISLIRLREQSVLEDMRSKFSLLEIQLQSLNQFPGDFKLKAHIWRDNAQGFLYSVNDKASKGEIVYELLVEDKNNPKSRIAKEGEDIAKELEKHKASPVETLERELNKIGVNFNPNFGNLIDTFCTFQAPESLLTDKNKVPDFGRAGSIISNPKSPEKFAKTSTTPTGFTSIKPLGDMASTFDFKYTSPLGTSTPDHKTKVSKLELEGVSYQEIHAPRSHRTPSQIQAKSPSNARSVSPGGRSIAGKQRKKLKVPVKYEEVLEGLENDRIDAADFFDAELGDNGVAALAELLKGNTKLKTLKLVKNKITDEGVVPLVNALYKNDTLENLHLSQNLLTDKAIDIFLDLFRNKVVIKTIFFNRNSINLRNVKNKVKEIMDLGINISL